MEATNVLHKAQDTTASWLKLLNPDSLKKSLIQTSLYITCWEMLKEAIIDQPRGFYSHEWKDGDMVPSPRYATEVLSLDRNVLMASAVWFKERDAISDSDIQTIRDLRSHRNEIAHELPKFIASTDSNVQLNFLNAILYLTQKIDKWWIQNIEIPTNPDFDGRQLSEQDLNEVSSMRMMFLANTCSARQG
jgi:hypothetical protein